MRKRRSVEERALMKEVSVSIKKVASEVRAKIRKGLDKDCVGQSITWGTSDTTYVRVVFMNVRRRKTMILEVVIGNFLLAAVTRGAGKPGLRERDAAALDKLVKEAPGLLVDSFKNAVSDLLSCGDPFHQIKDLLDSSRIGSWGRSDEVLS